MSSLDASAEHEFFQMVHWHPQGHGQKQWTLGKAGDCFQKDTTGRVLTILLKLLHGLLSQIRPFSWSFPLYSSFVGGLGRVAGRADPRLILVSELSPFFLQLLAKGCIV